MNVLCSVVAVGALAVAAWYLISGEVGREGLDAVFLLIVCALLAAVFAWIPLQALRKASRPKPPEKA